MADSGSNRLATLRETVGWYRCERCGFRYLVTELYEETETGLIVDKKCLDQLGVQEIRRDSPRDRYEHHFTT